MFKFTDEMKQKIVDATQKLNKASEVADAKLKEVEDWLSENGPKIVVYGPPISPALRLIHCRINGKWRIGAEDRSVEGEYKRIPINSLPREMRIEAMVRLGQLLEEIERLCSSIMLDLDLVFNEGDACGTQS